MAFDVPGWRIYLGLCTIVLAIAFRKPSVVFVFNLARKVFGKNARWVKDVERYLSGDLSWAIMFLWIYLALYLFNLTKYRSVNLTVAFIIGVPVILATLALRTVIIEILVRRYGWDTHSKEDFSRILMVKEGIVLLIYLVIIVEFFFIYLSGFDIKLQVLLGIVLIFEIALSLSAYTTAKNFVAGVFLVVSEPFRAGTVCRIANTTGSIESINFRNTIVRRNDGALVYIPNGLFFDSSLQSNLFADMRKVELSVHVSHFTDRETMEFFISELYQTLQPYLNDKNPTTITQDINQESSSESLEQTNTPKSSRIIMNFVRSLSSHFQDSTIDMNEEHEHIKEPKTLQGSLRIVCAGIFRVQVTCFLPLQDLRSLATMRTKINFTILEVMEKLGIQKYQNKIT